MSQNGEKILVVDDKPMMRDSVGAMLQRAGWTVIAAADAHAAMRMQTKHQPTAVITDLKMPEVDGLELLRRLREVDRHLPVVLMTAYGTVDTAVEAMKAGAFDFIQKPFEGRQLVSLMQRAIESVRYRQDAEESEQEQPVDGVFPSLVGRSAVMRELAGQIHKMAQSHGTVLIQGESGTGKEVVARMIHAMGPRKDRVMLCLNCAALSGSLLESELFGHERGAFTGADARRKGRFELADHGTLLLDEISEIDPNLQAKLLRVLQERQFERVGSSTTMEVDVRVIATTNRDLAQTVAHGGFRQDLFYRLNVLPIILPPLRDRLDDIPLLADHFFGRTSMRDGSEPRVLGQDAVELMMKYHWPGNVRELQNICERAHIMSRQTTIGAHTIEPWLQWAQPPAVASSQVAGGPGAGARPETGMWAAGMGRVRERYLPNPVEVSAAGLSASVPADGLGSMREPSTLEETERMKILQTLDRFGGNRRRTAEALGIGLRTLGLKLKKWKELKLVDAAV